MEGKIRSTDEESLPLPSSDVPVGRPTKRSAHVFIRAIRRDWVDVLVDGSGVGRKEYSASSDARLGVDDEDDDDDDDDDDDGGGRQNENDN